MCLLWHITHVLLPSEHQTQTSHPRSALQLALRYVRSTECIFYEAIVAVCDRAAGWGQVPLKSTRDDTVDCESSDSGWSNRLTQMTRNKQQHCIIKRFFQEVRQTRVLWKMTDHLLHRCLFCSVKTQLNVWRRSDPPVGFWGDCVMVSPEQLHLYTYAWGSRHRESLHISCHYLSPLQHPSYFLPTYLSLHFNCLLQYLFVFHDTSSLTWNTICPVMAVGSAFQGTQGWSHPTICKVHCVQTNRAIYCPLAGKPCGSWQWVIISLKCLRSSFALRAACHITTVHTISWSCTVIQTEQKILRNFSSDSVSGDTYLPRGTSTSSFLQRTLGCGSPCTWQRNSTVSSSNTTWLIGLRRKVGRSVGRPWRTQTEKTKITSLCELRYHNRGTKI